MTTSLRGTSSAGGAISTEMAFASCFETWKNRGSTSAQFLGVITFESAKTTVMHRRPSRRASRTSG